MTSEAADATKLAAHEIRFVDLCAGLGGFHRALQQAERSAARRSVNPFPKEFTFRCVMAAELNDDLRSLYLQNFPELVGEYERQFPVERVSQIEGLEDLYEDGRLVRVHGDLRSVLENGDKLRSWSGATDDFIVPPHDLLCAGFPCQPFSKSGAQKGFDDLNGTVFQMVAVIIRTRRPKYVMLENVGNFERHDDGNTWRRVREVLADLGYDVRATTHVGSADGDGLLSPHHLGLPHHRERFFILAQRRDTAGGFHTSRYPFPITFRRAKDRVRAREAIEQLATQRLAAILAHSEEHADPEELAAAALSQDRVQCVEHWNRLVARVHAHDEGLAEDDDARIDLPSFPIWGFELDPWNHYPIDENPAVIAVDLERLRSFRNDLLDKLKGEPWFRAEVLPRGERAYLANGVLTDVQLQAWFKTWPRYASSRGEWPEWKKAFIRQSRDWGLKLWRSLDAVWLRQWLDELLAMIPSHQKLEWNCAGGSPHLWTHVLQFRPSGLRVKRACAVPALVAMTSTQVPVVPFCGPTVAGQRALGRHLLPAEGLVLQGFPRSWALPKSRNAAYTALGNAVHVELVSEIVLSWLFEKDGPHDRTGQRLPAAADVVQLLPGMADTEALPPRESAVGAAPLAVRAVGSRFVCTVEEEADAR